MMTELSSMMNVKNRTIFCKDNLEILQGMNSACIDLIYLDPPFNKKKTFTAPIGSTAHGASFRDIFRAEDVKEEWVSTIKEDHYKIYELLEVTRKIEGKTSYNFCYLCYMAIRLIECHRILKEPGSLYLHCDPTMSHYLKILLDCIFNEKNFRNEIVWHYKGTGNPPKKFPAKHDVILFYAKSDMNRFNRIYTTAKKRSGWTGKDTKRVDSVWAINTVYQSQERATRTGYPTQKPLKLLEQIIKASSDESNVVLDPFCGCATTCVASEKLNRQWVGIDISSKAYDLVKERLDKEVYEEGLLKAGGEDLPAITLETEAPKRTDTNEDTLKKKNVYIISHPKYPDEYKVGIAKDVKERLNQYQTSDPNREYTLEYTIKVPYFRELENYIHTKFPNKHEWVSVDLTDIKQAMVNFNPMQQSMGQ